MAILYDNMKCFSIILSKLTILAQN
jgi:hypothetical protein